MPSFKCGCKTSGSPNLHFQEAETSTTKYRAPDRELLVIYEAVRYFLHILEARLYTILKDHNPPKFAFQRRGKTAHHASSNIYIIFHNSRRTFAPHLSDQENMDSDALPGFR
jgi:hypothetical protein